MALNTRVKSPAGNAPVSLGTVFLRVEGYEPSSDGNSIVAVRGENLETKEKVSIGLMSAARAANVFKRGTDDVVARQDYFTERFAKRKDIDAYASPESKVHVKPGGVLVMSDVRRDFADNQYYATQAWAFAADPMRDFVMSGVVELQKFQEKRDGATVGESIRLNLFQPENSFAATPENEALILGAFDPHCFKNSHPNAEIKRNVAVTFDVERPDGSIGPETHFVASGSLENKNPENEHNWSLTQSFHDLLQNTKLGRSAAIAVCALAAGMGVRNIDLNITLKHEDVQTRHVITEVFESVQRGETGVTVTPGVQPPLPSKSDWRSEIARENYVQRQSFEGSISLRMNLGDGKPAKRPFAAALREHSTQQHGPNNISRDPAKVKPIDFSTYAAGAHEKVQGVLKSAKADAERDKRQVVDRNFGAAGQALGPGF